MKLSIVIPIFNMEKHLTECLNSLVKQERINEIICVNDGSTDRSLNIIREFEKKDKRIKVIDKPNSGYGDSVNRGFAFASSDYVGILESDDIAVDGIYSEMMDIAEETKADIIRGNFNVFETVTNNTVYQNNMESFEYSKLISYKDYTNILFVIPAIWSAIYKKSFLVYKEIKLLPTPGASYQDLSFFFKSMISAENIYLIDRPVINYRCDTVGSSSNSNKKVFNIFFETAEMCKFLLEKNLENMFPELMRLKFANYKWSLNRLNENGKLKLLSHWLPELKEEFYAGYLRRDLWNDFDWYLVHLLLFNTKKAIEYFNNNCILKENYDPVTILKKTSPVYIYGAGKFGVIKKEELLSKGFNVTAFIVTEMKDNPSQIDGIPVLPLDKIDLDGIIILGLNETHRKECLDILNKRWLQNNVVEL